MPTCRTEIIFISKLRATFCAKHDCHAKMLKKIQFQRFFLDSCNKIFLDSEIFFSILNFFSRFRNIFLVSEIFFLILIFFSRFHIFFLDFIMFFFRLWNNIVDSNFFFLGYESFFSILNFFLDGGYRPPWCAIIT